MAVLTDKQLAAQICNWRKKKIDGPAFGIRTDQEFRGNPRLEVEGRVYQVAECRSDLEARELLARRSDDGLVLLFRVGHERLGEDLLARLAKERLLSVDARQTLRELFQAASIDPRILGNPKLVEVLVTAAAARGGVISPAGVLDMDLAWGVLLGNPELIHRRPDLSTLLRWSLDEDQWLKVRGLAPEVRKAFFAWVAERAGEAAHFMDAAESGGHREMLVPIGLALGLLFQDGMGNEGDRLEGRVRMEDYLGKQKIGAGPAMAWHLAAAAVVKDVPSLERSDAARRLDQLLKALKVEALAIHSDFSALGFGERIHAFRDALQRYGRRKAEQAGAELGACYRALQNHVLSGDPKHKERLQRAEMAIRLAIWLKQSEPNHREPATPLPLSLEDAMDGYLRELAFVDRARFALFGGDASDHELSQVYHQLAKQAAKIRQEQERQFGRFLASWNEDGNHGKIFLIEQVVAEVVAPVAKQRPVLLLVLDGMSGPVFYEILEDFARHGWLPVARDKAPVARPVLAALPSVTKVSRQALFSGRMDGSDKRDEQVAFREHPALAGASGKAKPRLFLKADLAEPGQSYLNNGVRDALASPTQRVAAVLLNVVDDQLSAADQLEVRWRIDAIHFLRPVLEAAAQAERLIVLTSDHGHVPDLNQTAKAIEPPNGSKDGGDRYRNASGKPPGPGELLIQGGRIKAATGGATAMILACEETVRYASKKAGYHGGASDLEVVIPLAVLDARNDGALEGRLSDELPAPAWWHWKTYLGEIAGDRMPKISTRRARQKPAGQETSLGDLPLFVGATPGPEQKQETATNAPWVTALLDSPIFKQQVQLMGKLAPKEAQVISFLTAMEKRGNAVLLTTLSADLETPAFRLRGLLSSLARLFNVDGYPVLEEDRASDTVRLDRKLLARQFELPE